MKKILILSSVLCITAIHGASQSSAVDAARKVERLMTQIDDNNRKLKDLDTKKQNTQVQKGIESIKNMLSQTESVLNGLTTLQAGTDERSVSAKTMFLQQKGQSLPQWLEAKKKELQVKKSWLTYMQSIVDSADKEEQANYQTLQNNFEQCKNLNNDLQTQVEQLQVHLDFWKRKAEADTKIFEEILATLSSSANEAEKIQHIQQTLHSADL